MKNFIRIFLIAGVLFLTFNVSGQNNSNPGAYMNQFSDQYKLVSKDMWDYMSAIARGKNARKVA